MIRRLTAVALLALITTAGCDAYRASRYREFTTLAETFVRAAMRADTLAMRRMAIEPTPAEWLKEMRENDPEYVAAAARGLRPSSVGTEDGLVLVRFEFPCRGRTDALAVVFVRTGRGWMIKQMSAPDRM
jgi:hypothetical protein